MRKPLTYKLFILLLVVSQWLTLAHASGHQLNAEEGHCIICALHDKFQTAVIATPHISLDLQKLLIRHDHFNCKHAVQIILTTQARAPPV